MLLDLLVRHQTDAGATVPRLPPGLVVPGFSKLISRLEYPAVRAGAHLPLPAAFGSPLPSPMLVLLLTLQTFLEEPITGRRIPPKTRDRFGPAALSALFLGKRPVLPVHLHPAVMTVDIISFLLEKPPIKFL